MPRLLASIALALACGGGDGESAVQENASPAATDPGAAIEKHIADGLGERYGQAIDRVDCPDPEGASIVCTAHLPGAAELPVDVSFPEDGGSFVAVEKPVVLLDKVARVVRERYAALGQTVIVDCGGAIRVSQPGTSFPCSIDGDLEVTVTVTSWQGRVELAFPE